MNQFGHVFREFRVNRGLTLKEVATKEISVSQLSRFERGDSNISLEKFVHALENLDVPIEDFMLVVRDFQRTETHEFMSKLIPLYYAKDMKRFQELQDREREKIAKAENPLRYQLNIILVQGLMNQRDSRFEVTQEDLNLVSDYLFQVEEWGVYEVILLGNLYSFYSADYVYRLGREIFELESIRKHLERHRYLLRLVALNFWLHCLEKRAFEEATYFKKQAASFLSSTKIYEKTIFLYIEGFELYQKEKKEEGIEKMKQAISIFEIVDSPEQVLYYQEHFDQFVGK